MIHSCDLLTGELPLSRLERKCHQLENLVAGVRHVARPGHTVVDFCAGGVGLQELLFSEYGNLFKSVFCLFVLGSSGNFVSLPYARMPRK